MTVPTVPPPTYEQQHAHRPSDDFRLDPSEAQLLISPTVDASSFQSGHLGAPAERAAIEGELQIKGVPVSLWTSLYVLFIPLNVCAPPMLAYSSHPALSL